MKKLLLFLFLALTCNAAVLAQMSEKQIIQYVQKQSAQGKDQQTIAKELLAKGITMKQLEYLRTKYGNMMDGSSVSISQRNEFSRKRVSNAEERDELIDVSYKPFMEKDSVKIFGHDIFRSKDLSFEPNMNIATPVNYVLGPNDEVILDVYGASQFSASFTVSPDGNITIPDEGPVHVAGMTVAQAQAKVKAFIGGHYQGSNIKLTVGQTRSIIVNVMGEVQNPGTYTLSAFASVFNALYMAGGVKDRGTLREIQVYRNGKMISSVDVYDYIINGKHSGNIMLRDNDVIIVGPYCNLVMIEGKVKRPMFYEMRKSESLQTLLNYAGGFTGDAYKKKVRVKRVGDEGLSVHNIDEWDFSSFKLADGDSAVVEAAVDRYRNTVKVSGAVFREGSYMIGTKINSVKTLIDAAGGLLEDAFTSRAVLHRIKEDRTWTTITVNIEGIMNGNAPDIMLQNEDELVINSVDNINRQRTLTILGEVFKPGIYKYSSKETVEDLITEAGGLLESASLLNVEVARRILSSEDNPTGKNTAKIYSLTLQNGLVIEGETGFELEPYDIVTIHRSPDYQIQKAVNVSGEVKYGGTYILSNKEERLTDILSRAGGLTANAYVNGVQVIRKISKKEMEIQRLKLEMARNSIDSLEVINAMQKTTYNVGVDLQKALAKPGSSSDIVIQEGDSIYIPQLNNVVKISGEVMFPNTVAYVEGKSASFYINQAGGLSTKGKKSLAYIVYPNGQVGKIRRGDVLPGCEIVVPTKPEKKIDTQRTSMWLALASTVSTIAAVLITALK